MVPADDDKGIKSVGEANGEPSRRRGQEDFLRGVEKLAGTTEELPDETPLGMRIKQLRLQKKLTPALVAQRTGLTPEELEAIEDGSLIPPLGLIMKLGKALDAELGTLMATGGQMAYTVVRQSQRQQMQRRPGDSDTSYGYAYEHLAAAKAGRAMEPFLVTLRPHAEAKPASQHDGQEFIFVLEGSMEALVGEAREILEPGDSIYYDSSVPHLVRAVGDKPARILAVLTGGK